MARERAADPRRHAVRSGRAVRSALAALLVVVVSACGGPGGTATSEPSDASPSASPTPTPVPATPAPTASPSPVVVPDPSTWPLAWSDEFDGPAGTPPDPAVWGHDLGDGSANGLVGWGNNEREFYTDSPDNAATDGNGNLLLTVRAADGSQSCYYGPCQYTSARLVTRDRYEIQYGRIEARIRVPEGFGLWPAFWMLGTDIGQVGWPVCGEIDVMEFLGRRPNEILGTIHGPGYSGSSGLTRTVDLGGPVAAEFHTFAIEWRPGHIAWLLDGTTYFEVGPDDVAPNAWVFDQPFFLMLNVAVGGNLGGPVDPNLALPASMAVDYVRVYRWTTP